MKSKISIYFWKIPFCIIFLFHLYATIPSIIYFISEKTTNNIELYCDIISSKYEDVGFWYLLMPYKVIIIIIFFMILISIIASIIKKSTNIIWIIILSFSFLYNLISIFSMQNFYGWLPV